MEIIIARFIAVIIAHVRKTAGVQHAARDAAQEFRLARIHMRALLRAGLGQEIQRDSAIRHVQNVHAAALHHRILQQSRVDLLRANAIRKALGNHRAAHARQRIHSSHVMQKVFFIIILSEIFRHDRILP